MIIGVNLSELSIECPRCTGFNYYDEPDPRQLSSEDGRVAIGRCNGCGIELYLSIAIWTEYDDILMRLREVEASYGRHSAEVINAAARILGPFRAYVDDRGYVMLPIDDRTPVELQRFDNYFGPIESEE